MKNLIPIICLILAVQVASAQKFVSKKSSNVSVRGTSSLHNWEGRATEFQGDITATIEDG